MPERLDHKIRKARKDHTCDYCNGIIKKGEEYDWSKMLYEGTLYEWKAHRDCIMVATELWDLADPYDGMSEEDFREACQEFCDVFCCPDCEHYENDCDEYYCLEKVVAKLKTHSLIRDPQHPYKFKLEPREEE